MALTREEALAAAEAAAEAADRWPAGYGWSWALMPPAAPGNDWEEVDEDDPPKGAYG